MSDKLKVVMFAGGRGAGTICEALVQHPSLCVTLLVNAYDDGLSTGALRRFIPGMLGPSDVRKNLSRLIPHDDRADRALRFLFEYRFPLDTTAADALGCLADVARLKAPSRFPEIGAALAELSCRQALAAARYCTTFVAYAEERARAGETFDFADCSFGNLLFAGAFLDHGRDFNATIAALSEVCHPRGQVINVTAGENLCLVGLKEDGTYLKDEATLVAKQSVASLSEIFLLREPLSASEQATLEAKDFEGKRAFLAERSVVPRLNPAAQRALAEADIIIYGPGTQHSSLFPSYLTDGVAEVVSKNVDADKFFVANILKDHEIRKETASSLVNKFLMYMSRKGAVPVGWNDVITKFFFQHDELKNQSADYVAFDHTRFPFPIDSVVVTDWEIQNGVHSGGRFRDELIRFVNARLTEKLKTLPHLVSIVVPALNEARTVQRVLHELAVLDFQSLGLSKEIIFVDGGSTDGTLELAKAVPHVKAFELQGPRGRGNTVRYGFAKAAGNIVVTFPADGEYSARDLIPIVMAIVKNEYEVVFGSRNIKCINLSEKMSNIYQGNKLGYLVGKYGGLALSIVGLLGYNRFISDPLTGIKAFDAKVLHGLGLESRGLDLETEICAKVCLNGVFVLEHPVAYFPRRRNEGKKSRLGDGVAALWTLLRYCVAKKPTAPPSPVSAP